MTPPIKGQSAMVAGGALALSSSRIAGGVLPGWVTYAVVGGSAVLAAAVLLATGAFTVALMLLFAVPIAGVVLYAWSRAVEGPRRAKDRVLTLLIASAF